MTSFDARRSVGMIRAHRAARRADGRIGLNLTSMIDVVFLLLVYFMVATEFRIGEEIFTLELPRQRAAASSADPFDLDEEPLRITVRSLGPGATDYRLSLDGPYDQPGTYDALTAFLTAQQINDRTPGGLFLSDHPIVLSPDRATMWEHTVGAFNAIVRADYTNVTMSKPQ